ncbi:unnamed protein product [Gongylonema pulchrum]|uniref:Uncharacterized protein n=1 Tax=Gongylonema pulchrum TaxID=637853 RepID=A0A183EMZ7_9BILA|nr:unnamed protein product [Gongylonema pulchrum]
MDETEDGASDGTGATACSPSATAAADDITTDPVRVFRSC